MIRIEIGHKVVVLIGTKEKFYTTEDTESYSFVQVIYNLSAFAIKSLSVVVISEFSRSSMLSQEILESPELDEIISISICTHVSIHFLTLTYNLPEPS